MVHRPHSSLSVQFSSDASRECGPPVAPEVNMQVYSCGGARHMASVLARASSVAEVLVSLPPPASVCGLPKTFADRSCRHAGCVAILSMLFE